MIIEFLVDSTVVCVSPKAGSEKRTWVQAVYFGNVRGSRSAGVEQGEKE